MKHIEKIILLIAVLAATGIYFFVVSSDPISLATDVRANAQETDYKITEVPPVLDLEIAWANPVPQSEDGLWLYDVFTPPRIYINPETGEMEPTPFMPPPAPPAFGLNLVAFERDPFRVQLDGYVEQDLADISTSILIFLDNENSITVRGRVGDVLEEQEIRIEEFSVERIISDEDSTISRIPRVVLTDLRNNERLAMTTGQKIFGSEISLQFAHEEFAGEVFEATEQGEVLEIGEERFEILAINLSGSTVRVRKTSPLLEEAEEATLSVERRPSPARESRQEREEQPTENFFDFPF